MAAKTLAFAVQLGTGGFTIARAVADRLNYRYYDSEVTRRAATQAGVSLEALLAAQYAPSLWERVLSRLGVVDLTDMEASYPGPAEMSMAIRNLHSDNYRFFVEHVVEELAGQGHAVIVGHAAQMVLREDWSALRILIVGSLESRLSRLRQEENLSVEKARRMIVESDRERKEFFKHTYRVDLLDPRNYDFVASADRVSLESIVVSIVNLALDHPGPYEESLGEAAKGQPKPRSINGLEPSKGAAAD